MSWPRMTTSKAVAACTAVLLCTRPQLGRAGECFTADDGAALSFNNSVYNEFTGSGVPTAGPKFPAISSRATRTYGATGSCVCSAAESFDGGEIVVGATISMSGPNSVVYGKIMRHTIEIFLAWLNIERYIPDQTLAGGLMVGGKRYSMRFVWTDDRQEPSEAAASIAHSIRRESAHFGWGGYGSTMSRLQAEQTELDGVLFMASIGVTPNIFEGRELTFGTLPPDNTYIQNAVRAVAEAATGIEAIPAVGSMRVGLIYQSDLHAMCTPIVEVAQGLGMVMASERTNPWLPANELLRYPTKDSVDSVLRRLRADSVNFVVSCVYHDGGEAIVEGLERLDYTPHAAAFTSTVDISKFQARVNAGWWQGE